MHAFVSQVNRWIGSANNVALATVVATWGSSPRQIGAKMAVNQNSEIAGSVSGGCVEGAVVQESLEVLAGGPPRLLDFGVSDETAWSVGLSCGGKITVFLECLAPDWWKELVSGMDANRGQASLTILEGPAAGDKMIVSNDGSVVYARPDWPEDLQNQALLQAAEAIRRRNSVNTEILGTRLLIDLQIPRPRLLIVGGAHVAQSLHRLAGEMGFRTILVDPRRAFATSNRFPGAENIYHDYPQEVFREIGLDRDTYVAVLTHDPKIDDQALLLALPSVAPYIGVLSSRKTHKKRLSRLLEAGADPKLLERIHTPIGLEIGARTPEEIALAIMAEIIAVRRKRD